MRLRGIVAAASAVLLAGCGSDGGETATAVKTVTVTAPAEPETPSDDQASDEELPSAPAGLPDDGVALTGDFGVDITDRTPPQANASGESAGLTHLWRLTTSCEGGDCELEVRRRLDSGGFKDVTLQPIADRPGQWFGEFRGTAECGASSKAVDQSLTIRPLNPVQVDGGAVARRFEAYFRADLECFGDPPATNKNIGELGKEVN